ncbi:MAG: hypothetical protein KJZ91_11835 [Myxococcales bacterium]|nr:hypothetical protein [Myxococcales bacterium]
MSCEPGRGGCTPGRARRAGAARAVLVALAALVAAACTRTRAPASPRAATVPVPTVRVGDCANPESDGVHGAAPRFRRADRDLDGDGTPEAVVADETMCTADGNCYWNVFVRTEAAGCDRYAGALAGAVLEPLPGAAAGAWPALRAYWNLGGGKRVLVQEYQFRRGGYVLTDTLVCRREADDRLLCSEDTR